jgi:hypothetical protein
MVTLGAFVRYSRDYLDGQREAAAVGAPAYTDVLANLRGCGVRSGDRSKKPAPQRGEYYRPTTPKWAAILHRN